MFGLSKRVLLVVGALVAVLLLFFFKDKDASADCGAKVTADSLNIRSSPDRSAPVVGQYTRGDSVQVGKTARAGFRKTEDGQWVAASYLSMPKC